MLQPLKHFSVNWIDGMKINKDHFEQLDNYFTERLRDAYAINLNSLNYGICYSDDALFKSLNVKVSIDPAKIIRVQLLSCRAITAGGCRIEYGNPSGLKANFEQDKLQAEYYFDDSREKNFYILLSVNIHARSPVGQPDANETPARQPFIGPSYQLQILPETQIDAGNPPDNALIIGQLTFANGKMKLVENFIPASTIVKSSPVMYDEYFKLGNYLGETQNNIYTIFEKIHGKSQSTSLVKSCSILCNDVAGFIANDLGSYRWVIAEQPPVYLFNTFLRLAYRMTVTLQTMPVKDKEELINYICEWVEESPAQVTEKIKNLIKFEYRHTSINDALEVTTEFMVMVYGIFNKLAQLDFIGKKKGERAFVQEKKVDEVAPIQETKKSGGFSFLAE